MAPNLFASLEAFIFPKSHISCLITASHCKRRGSIRDPALGTEPQIQVWGPEEKRPQRIYTPCPPGGLRLSASPLPHPGKAHAVAFVPDVAGTQHKAWLCAVLPSLRTQT